MTKKQPEKDTE